MEEIRLGILERNMLENLHANVVPQDRLRSHDRARENEMRKTYCMTSDSNGDTSGDTNAVLEAVTDDS